MSNSIAPGSSADVNVKVTALTTNPNVPVTYKTIILKKNLVNGVNTLTQEMMSIINTKYVIKYNYVLSENITIPENCILEFDGGSINEGIITLSVGCNIIDVNHKLNTNLYIIAANGCYIDGININISDEMTNHIIHCNGVNNVVIKNVKTNVEKHLGNYNSCGICIENNSTNVLVEKCTIYRNEMISAGAETATAPIIINDSTHLHIIDNNIIGSEGDGIYVGGTSSHILIKGCYVDFSGNNYTDGWSGIACGASVTNPNILPEYVTCEGCTVIGGIATMYSFNANNSILTNCIGRNNTNLGGIALGHPGDGARIHNTIVSNCIIERDNTNHSNKKAAICPFIDGPVLIDKVKFIGKEIIAAIKVTGKETIDGVKPLVKVTNCYAKYANVFLDQELSYNTEDASDVDVEIENCTLDSGYSFAYNNAAPDKYIIKGCIINTATTFCNSGSNSITDIINCIGNVTNSFLNVGAAKQVNLINNKVIGVNAIILNGAPDVININGGEYNLSTAMIHTEVGECSICNLSIKNSIIHFVTRLVFSAPDIPKDFGVYSIENNTIYAGSGSTLIWLNGTFNRNAPLLTVRGNIIHNTGNINIIVTRGSVASGVSLTSAYCQLMDNILDTSYTGNNDDVRAYKTIYTSRNVVGGVVEIQS